MAITPEGKVKARVKKVLEEAQAWQFMPIIMGPMGRHGVPDILACVPVKITSEMVGKTIGAFVAVETKAPKKLSNTTPNQRKELAEIGLAKGIALVADAPDIVQEAIEKLKTTGENMVRITGEENGYRRSCTPRYRND